MAINYAYDHFQAFFWGFVMHSVEKLKESFEKITLILIELKKDPDIPLIETLDTCYDRLTHLIGTLDSHTIHLQRTQNMIYQILDDLGPIMETLGHYKDKYTFDVKQNGSQYQALQSYKRYKM